MPAHALENGVPHLYVNRVGRQDGVSFGGTSMAVGPEGTVLAEAGPAEEKLLQAEIGDAGRRDARTRYVELLWKGRCWRRGLVRSAVSVW